MDISRAQTYFEAGDLTRCTVSPISSLLRRQDHDSGKTVWGITLRHRSGAQSDLTHTKTKELREFVSLDSAWTTARKIGFRAIEVVEG